MKEGNGKCVPFNFHFPEINLCNLSSNVYTRTSRLAENIYLNDNIEKKQVEKSKVNYSEIRLNV